VYTRTGELDSARHYFDRVLALEPESAFGRFGRAGKLYLEKRFDLMRAELASQERLHIVDGENWYNISQEYGLINDAGGVARTLERAVERGFFNYPLMLSDPMLASVRGSPEVARALELAKARYESFKQRHPELRESGGDVLQ
jgi:hypothetical protein